MSINIDNLHIILNHFYDDEIDDLEVNSEVNLPENIGDAIKFCENEGYTDHIIYNLMLLKQDLQNGSRN